MRKLKNSELNRLSVDEFKRAVKIPVVVILDNIRSLSNIGSVFRTSDAFRVQEIYLCGITARPPHPEIHKTALGATDSVDWKYFEEVHEAIFKLKNSGYKVYAIEQAENSIELNDIAIKADDKLAIIFGNEVKGVSDKAMKLVDCSIELNQYGTKHSLNISVSAGIVIWELFKVYQHSLI
ncbi:MAG: RNA methyltransferase [Saprospiraceae bacterium]|nr:RNA methyltransferase [Saprospiraceae bacterium]